MSHHHHEHHKHSHHQPSPAKKPLHRNWGVIAAAILILIAMLTYVLTMDESAIPGSLPNDPAVTSPANP